MSRDSKSILPLKNMNPKVAAIGLFFSVLLLTALYFLSDRLDIREKSDFLRSQHVSLYTEGSGETIKQWTSQDKKHFNCIFNHSEVGYRCGYDIGLANSYMQGEDLSGFEAIVLKLSYEGPARKIRISYRNGFLNANVTEYGKQHEVLVPIRNGSNEYSLPLSEFVVPEWWLGQYKSLPVSQKAPQRDNVIHVGFDIETPMVIGAHDFSVEAFYAAAPMMDSIGGIWFACTVGVLILLCVYLTYVLIMNVLRKHLYTKLQRSEKAQKSDVTSMFSALHSVQLSSERAMNDDRGRVLDPKTMLLPRATAELAISEYAQTKDMLGSAVMLVSIDQLLDIHSRQSNDFIVEVFKSLNMMIKGAISHANITVHWETDKILVVSPEIYPSEVFDVAEKIKSEAAKLQFSRLGESVTVSIGVVNMLVNETFSEAVTRADKALASAHEAGGNTVFRLR